MSGGPAFEIKQGTVAPFKPASDPIALRTLPVDLKAKTWQFKIKQDSVNTPSGSPSWKGPTGSFYKHAAWRDVGFYSS